MTENGNQCPIWGTYADIIDRPDGRDGTLANSPRAGGQYFIARTATQMLEARNEHLKARLTSWLIEQRQFGESCPNITSTTIKDAEQRKALRVSERANRILRYVETKTAILGSEVNYRFPASYNINLDNHAIVYWNLLSHSESIGPDDFIFLLNYLDKEGLIENTRVHDATKGCILTIAGCARLAELEGTYTVSSKAFVAMWFHDSMNAAWDHGFKPAISEAGYDAIRIDQKEHANKIDDEIVAEIRRARFVVADFTHGGDGARGGVYYEAGFAHGLGIPVIFSCRADVLEKIHFDTRQYNHIVWKEPGELRDRLITRIAAVIGDGPLKSNGA